MAVNAVSGSSLALLSQLLQFTGSRLTGSGLSSSSAGSTDGLRETYRLSFGLREAIQELQAALRKSSPYPGQLQPSTAVSSVTLVPTTYSTLNGTQEVNATPTSFSPFGPTWKRGSTSLVSVTGIYSGIDGTTEQKVRVITGGTVGGSSALVLRASIQSKTEDITIPAGTPANTPFTLSNGIVLRLSAGTLIRNDDIDIDLNSTVGSVVDPNKPFNGIRSDYPNLQYGLDVTAGSFTVNGVSISVAAADTLNQVLAKITNSAAGVTALFDAATETVRLTRKTPGPEPIALAGDTSGFLAAAKLAGATAVLGSDERTVRIASVPKLSGIETGTLYVNDVPISVDTNVDSMEAVLARINASGAGVTASIADGQIRLAASAAFAIRDGTSGFFEGIGIEAGRYGSRKSGGVKGGKSVIDAMAKVSEMMSDLFGSGDVSAAAKNRLRQAFETIAARAFRKTGPRFDSNLGVRMDFSSGVNDVLSFSQNDRNRLEQALQNRHITLRKFFLSPMSAKGESFLDLLSAELKNVESEIEGQLSGTGLRLNVSA